MDYEIIKNIDKIYKGISTGFLDGRVQKTLLKRLPKKTYKIYKPYPDSEKVIFYVNETPKVALLEIECKEKLKHQDVLGAVFSLGVSSEVFGDIIVDDKYYIYVLDSMKEYFINNLINVKKYSVHLREINLDLLRDYKRKYEEFSLTVSSERIDLVIGKIIHTNRTNIKVKVKNKEIMLNYDYLDSASKVFKKGDIFSIRKYGKYRYDGIVKKTKKGGYVVRCYKYL